MAAPHAVLPRLAALDCVLLAAVVPAVKNAAGVKAEAGHVRGVTRGGGGCEHVRQESGTCPKAVVEVVEVV